MRAFGLADDDMVGVEFSAGEAAGDGATYNGAKAGGAASLKDESERVFLDMHCTH